MAIVIVNGHEIEIGDAERLNGIQAAARAGAEVPHYCWHPGLSVVASCRMCLVETGTRNAETGEISMVPKLVPACQTPAKDGAIFVTDSEKVQKARAMVEEDLLIDHPIDCPICDKAGECSLQDYHFKYGQTERRADIRPFTSRRRPLGDTVTLFVDRCVMCSRCVRFTREISGSKELMIVNRGSHEEIDVFPGYPLDNKMSGNVCDICPVGALGDKEFLYSQRVWFMKNHDHVCTGCSTGCSIHVDENHDQIYRLRPRENAAVNQWWMCDEGRYGWKYMHDERRIVCPQRRSADGESLENVEWSVLNAELDQKLRAVGRLAVVLSPHLTVEEAYLLALYIRSIDSEAMVALGPFPIDGEDETFPNGFVIRGEKCPNRRGVEEVVAHFMRRACGCGEVLEKAALGEIGGAWVTGGYPNLWHDDESISPAKMLQLLIVQDLFPSPLSARADYILPAAGFAEREGSYVNHADRLQSFRWAIRAPSGVKVEGRLYWELLQKSGMYNARAVLDELAREATFFAAAVREIPPTGLDLHSTQLAAT